MIDIVTEITDTDKELDIEGLVASFTSREPELILAWQDKETSAKAWLVLNSLRGGAAGGGTRMHSQLTLNEVIFLAKTMELKFSVTGPNIGGAKSGICFDPADPRRRDVLRRWFKIAHPVLKAYYGTGGDMNVSEVEDVVPITTEYGLKHPQEGIVNGFYRGTKLSRMIRVERLRNGMAASVTNPDLRPKNAQRYCVADLITGYGVAKSVAHYYDLWGGTLLDKRAIIQGWGNVAAITAFYLAKWGVRVVGIIDKVGGVLAPEGLSLNEVEHLVAHAQGNALVSPAMKPFEWINEQIWDIPADIFIPGAASRIVSKDHMSRLIKAGLELVACGANVPFIEENSIYGPTTQYVDAHVALLPDFISNGGKAGVFAYLMNESETLQVTPEAIFENISYVIQNALQAIKNQSHAKKHITKQALHIALNTLREQPN